MAAAEPELHSAVKDGRIQDVAQLLDDGANLDARNVGGGHVLHVAVRAANSEMIQLLLDRGTDVNVRGYRGATPLAVACMGKRQSRREAVIRQLILNGADLRAQTDDLRMRGNTPNAGMRTPLHIAVGTKNIQTIRLLLLHGADISISESDEFNALHLAVQVHKAECLSEQARFRINPYSTSYMYKIEKADKVVNILLSHGTDVYAKIAILNAKTKHYAVLPAATPEQIAYTDDMKEMLQAALKQAEAGRRALLEAMTMGQHKRLGERSWMLQIDPEVVQMIMDRV